MEIEETIALGTKLSSTYCCSEIETFQVLKLSSVCSEIGVFMSTIMIPSRCSTGILFLLLDHFLLQEQPGFRTSLPSLLVISICSMKRTMHAIINSLPLVYF
jgi:hypothetical protein